MSSSKQNSSSNEKSHSDSSSSKDSKDSSQVIESQTITTNKSNKKGMFIVSKEKFNELNKVKQDSQQYTPLNYNQKYGDNFVMKGYKANTNTLQSVKLETDLLTNNVAQLINSLHLRPNFGQQKHIYNTSVPINQQPGRQIGNYNQNMQALQVQPVQIMYSPSTYPKHQDYYIKVSDYENFHQQQQQNQQQNTLIDQESQTQKFPSKQDDQPQATQSSQYQKTEQQLNKIKYISNVSSIVPTPKAQQALELKQSRTTTPQITQRQKNDIQEEHRKVFANKIKCEINNLKNRLNEMQQSQEGLLVNNKQLTKIVLKNKKELKLIERAGSPQTEKQSSQVTSLLTTPHTLNSLNFNYNKYNTADLQQQKSNNNNYAKQELKTLNNINGHKPQQQKIRIKSQINKNKSLSINLDLLKQKNKASPSPNQEFNAYLKKQQKQREIKTDNLRLSLLGQQAEIQTQIISLKNSDSLQQLINNKLQQNSSRQIVTQNQNQNQINPMQQHDQQKTQNCIHPPLLNALKYIKQQNAFIQRNDTNITNFKKNKVKQSVYNYYRNSSLHQSTQQLCSDFITKEPITLVQINANKNIQNTRNAQLQNIMRQNKIIQSQDILLSNLIQ